MGIMNAFIHLLAITTSGMEMCARRDPTAKPGIDTQFGKVRTEYPDILFEAELDPRFNEYVAHETAMAARESSFDIDKYCLDMPVFIGNLSKAASMLRSLRPR
jgi:hypothetical protein